MSELARTLAEHRTTVTPVLIECACGWYAKRGEGVGGRHAEHVAEALAPVLNEARAMALREAAEVAWSFGTADADHVANAIIDLKNSGSVR